MHFCQAPGCSEWAAFGFGVNLLRHAAANAQGEAVRAEWLGVWFCRVHATEYRAARICARGAAAERRCVNAKGQGVLL